MARRILVINGPNLNMLGKREPQIYGSSSFAALLDFIAAAAAELGVDVECRQSNHEGAIVDMIQSALGVFDGIIINPAAYTHTSIAILDALKAVALPTIEVHLSAPSKREDFRRVSFVRPAAAATFEGHGFEGYKMAIKKLCEILG